MNTEELLLHKRWSRCIYRNDDPCDLSTLYGQLARVATNRAVYHSIRKMTQSSGVAIDSLVKDFITDGFAADLVMSTRRLLETNKRKMIDKQVNSIRGLIEYLEDVDLSRRLDQVGELVGDEANKIFAHNDHLYAEGFRILELTSFDGYDEILNKLRDILGDAALKLDIVIPDRLVATNQYDWGQCFDRAWRPRDFDDSEIWNAL